jgi:hypothetical protein
MYIDHSVYPDVESPPDVLDTDADKADYLDRVCAAWDFGVFPERETINLFRGWKDIFDRYPRQESSAYRRFRQLYDWDLSPAEMQTTPRLLYYEILDRWEGRGPDPCENMV